MDSCSSANLGAHYGAFAYILALRQVVSIRDSFFAYCEAGERGGGFYL